MNFLLHTIIGIALWIPVALGFSFVFGRGKIFHFGPLGTALVASYAIFLTLLHTGSFVLACGAGIVVVAILSLCFAWLALRLTPDGFGVFSIAVHLSLLTIILNAIPLTRGAMGIPNIPRMAFIETLPRFALVASLIAALCTLFFVWISRSMLGRKLAALAEQECSAAALGVRRTVVVSCAFLLLGMAQVVSALFFAQYLRLLHPSDFQFSSFIFLVTIVVAGKPGSVRGVVIATIVLTFLREGLRLLPLAPSFVGPVRLVLFGLILFLGVLWRRSELFPAERTV